MSGSIGLVSASFTDAEKADVRRFCGYPAYGAGNSGFQGYRFFQAYGTMEFRLTNMRPEERQVARQFLSALYVQETAVWGSGDNLDTDQAAVWTHNKNEVRDRTRLLAQTRRDLCLMIGIPPGPGLGAGGTISLVI